MNYSLFVIFQVCQELKYGLIQHRMQDVRSYICKRPQYKPPFMQTGMWNCQVVCPDNQVFEEQYVEIHNARTKMDV